MALCKVVSIDEKKCTNCHTCITVCPIKYCLNDKDTVTINDDLCIGCGRCYNACPHNAISIIDDFQDFIDSTNSGKKSILIVSPAILVTFKDQHKNLITWLKQNFVLNGIFDEGLGAELATILYMQYMTKKGKIPIISQQCPTVVEYIKIFYPELLFYLAPFQSPVIILAELIRKIYQFDGIIAYLGPCLSKRREFRDPDTNNMVQYNITIENLLKYIDMHKVNLDEYKQSDFDFIPAERGSVFCKSGGFINIIKRYYENPKMHQIEGKIIYKDYLKELLENIDDNFKYLPLLIDILNCKGGCYHGPAGVNDLSIPEENWYIEEQEEDSIKKYNNKFKAQTTFEQILTKNAEIKFNRNYFSENAKPIYTLKDKQLKEHYKSLLKFEKRDFLNCRSCGFYSCQEFATSLHYELNILTNCRNYNEITLKKINNNNSVVFEEISLNINKLNEVSQTITKLLEKTKNAFTKISNQITHINSLNNYLKIDSDQLNPIISAISEISEQINLLSFNAAIEASRTGKAGKGFSVVSSEIRNLADKTKIEINKMSPIAQSIINNSDEIYKNMNNITIKTDGFFNSIKTLYSGIIKINNAFNNLMALAKKIE